MILLNKNNIDKLGSFDFEGNKVRIVSTTDGSIFYVVYDLCKVLGINNRSSLFKGADDRVKASGVFTFDEEVNPQRYNLVDIRGLQYIVYRAKSTKVNRLDFVETAEEVELV